MLSSTRVFRGNKKRSGHAGDHWNAVSTTQGWIEFKEWKRKRAHE
jgi:hypothetical protein